jgi:hypothetical protein
MPLLRIIAVAPAWPLLAGVSLSAAACGGNEFVLSSDAAGSTGGDAGSGSDAGGDSGGVAGPFCDALSAYYAHCQFNMLCDRRNLDNCGAFSAALSDVARNAFISCAQSMSIQCARGGAAWVRESCVSAKLAAGTPTLAQSRLANDYCNACPQTAAGMPCTPRTFFQQSPLGAAADGPGFDSLLYNDTLVKSVDQMCANSRTCDLAFKFCEGLLITAQVPADACPDAG